MFTNTCFKRGFKSSVSSGGVKVAPEMYPDHVTRALYRTWVVGATYGFWQNCTIFSFKNSLDHWVLHVGFSDFQVVILAVHALLQLECRVESDLNLALWGND